METKKPLTRGGFEKKILEPIKFPLSSGKTKNLIKEFAGNPKNHLQNSEFEKSTTLTKISEKNYPLNNGQTTIYGYSRNNVKLTIIQEIENEHYLTFTPTLFYQKGNREELAREIEKKENYFFASRSQ